MCPHVQEAEGATTKETEAKRATFNSIKGVNRPYIFGLSATQEKKKKQKNILVNSKCIKTS